MKIIKAVVDYFKAEKIEYWHRNRTIEIIALEKGIDIQSIQQETQVILKNEGRIEAISKLRHRFHVPLSIAWRFVDKLDLKGID